VPASCCANAIAAAIDTTQTTIILKNVFIADLQPARIPVSFVRIAGACAAPAESRPARAKFESDAQAWCAQRHGLAHACVIREGTDSAVAYDLRHEDH
jgi:hypothetical protein